MDEFKDGIPFAEKLKALVNEGKIDEAVKEIGTYLNLAPEEEYLDKLENIIETVSILHGGRTVIRFLIENLIIDIPSLLKNLSARDPIIRYSFLLLLKPMCENEMGLFLPYGNDLLKSEDPNVKEAYLQLLIFMAGGDNKIDDDSLIKTVVEKLSDDREYVVEKAEQALKLIGKRSPGMVTKKIKEHINSHSDDQQLKETADEIIKSLVSVDTVKEIEEVEETEEIEEEKPKKEEGAKKEPTEEKKEAPIADKKIVFEEKDKEAKKPKEEKKLPEKEKMAEEEQIELIKEEEIDEDLKKEEEEIVSKKKDLKKKELELKKKELELDEKEIETKQKSLDLKEELIKKDTKLSELTQVEIELKNKEIKEKEEKIKLTEAQRIDEKLDTTAKKEEINDKSDET